VRLVWLEWLHACAEDVERVACHADAASGVAIPSRHSLPGDVVVAPHVVGFDCAPTDAAALRALSRDVRLQKPKSRTTSSPSSRQRLQVGLIADSSRLTIVPMSVSMALSSSPKIVATHSSDVNRTAGSSRSSCFANVVLPAPM
jgi:hypothetical protein